MDIALLYFDDCPNWKVAEERLAAIAAERADLEVTRHLVDTLEEAERVGFHGSPSILVNGVDVFAEPDAGVGLSCRVYRTPDGPAGAPTVEQLRAALAVAGGVLR
jgi:protein-disulfide isomerase